MTSQSKVTRAEEAWERWTQPPLVLASLIYLITYSLRVMGELTGTARHVANLILTLTWAMFAIDYLVRFVLARHRGKWFITHWFDLLCVILPVLRLVLLLRIFTKFQGRRATPGDRMRIQILVYGMGSSAILIYLSALAVLEPERQAPGATITTFKTALWWAVVTVTTTGYGDYTPITLDGRLVGTGLMFGGLLLLGVTTATFASLMVEIASRHASIESGPATRGQIADLQKQVEALTAELRSANSDRKQASEATGASASPGQEHSGTERGTSG